MICCNLQRSNLDNFSLVEDQIT